MNGAAAVQGGLAVPVQGRSRDARVTDDAAGTAQEAGEEFDDLLSQGTDAAEPTDAEPPAEETSSGGRQVVTVVAIAGLNFALAVPDGDAAAAAPEAPADATVARTATPAAPVQQAGTVDLPEGAPQDPTIKTEASSAAEALTLLDSSSEAGAAPRPAVPARRPDETESDETVVTIRSVKRETHFAPVATRHLAAAAAVQEPAPDTTIGPAAMADGTEPSLDAPRGPVVVAQRAGGGEADGKSETDGSREGSGGDRRPIQAAAASGTEFAGAVAGIKDISGTASPAQQIAQRVTGELGASGSLAATRLETTQSGPGDGMTKVLHIQLEPANLGPVTVRVSLKDNVLTLHVEAARHETALAIEKDRDLLSGTLKRAGYMVDGITAQPADIPRVNAPIQAAADAQSSFSSSTQSQSGHSQSGQQSGLRNTRTDGSGEDRSSHRGAEPAAGVNDSARGVGRGVSGELYV